MKLFISSLFIACLGAITGGSVMYLIDSRQLAQAQAATATVREQHARDLTIISDAALTAEREASAISRAAAQKIEALDAQLTKERQTHEADNRNYRVALAAGTERLRVAVSNCSAGGSGMSGLPALPAWAMEPPLMQTSTERLRNAFSGPLLMINEK